MSLLRIKIYPDPVLREMCLPIVDFDQALHNLLDDMHETMRANSGVGLAASQVGELLRVVVIDVSEEGNQLIELVNPEIISQSGKISLEEGCLSIPDYRDKVPRSAEVLVNAQDRYGKNVEIRAEGLLAVCIQHEIDHLNGILFVDRLSRLKRELFKRWAKKRGSLDSAQD